MNSLPPDPLPTSPPYGARAAAWALIAFVAFWPKFGVSELIALLAGVAVLVATVNGCVRLRRAQWLMLALLFFSFWLPELLSAPDALARDEAWREVALDLRYAPFLMLVIFAAGNTASRTLLYRGLGVIVAVWLVDALVQAATGFSLGGPAEAERLSGIFGADNLKLGWVLAVLSPFALQWAARRGDGMWLLAAAALSLVVLLAGARAAWLALALVLVGSAWLRFGGRKQLLLATATLVLAALALAWVGSERFGQRIERTAAVLSGDSEGLDVALSYRLPIWRAAGRMIVAHPLNGIGVRGFREAYPQFVADDDHWMQGDNTGAFHAHQWLLEVLAETGALGMACWLIGLGLLAWQWCRASAAIRARARAPALAVLAALFPFNTHLALYSSFWSGVLLLLLGLLAGTLVAVDEEPVK